jgi:hypothetical protein
MILGLVGSAGSGKSTVAARLVSHHGFVGESFAGPLKDAVAAIFGWDRDKLEGVTPESRVWREHVDRWWAARLNMPSLTPRFALQYVGTELMRNEFHDEIWIAALQNRLCASRENVVISDVRFPNEANAIRTVGGFIVRVERPSLVRSTSTHATEAYTSDIPVDTIVLNDGDLTQLNERIDGLLDALSVARV